MKKEQQEKTNEKVNLIKRIVEASVRCGKAGWQILAYLGKVITNNYPLAKLNFFKKTGVIFLGLIALIFSTLSFPTFFVAEAAKVGVASLAESKSKQQTNASTNKNIEDDKEKESDKKTVQQN